MFTDKTNSSVVQLNSTRGIGGERAAVHVPADPRPSVADSHSRPGRSRRCVSTSAAARTSAPAARTSRPQNELDQDVYELTDDFTWLKGRHTFTLGTHNEFFKFRNLFIRDNFGNYRFASLDLFEQGIAQGYDYSFSVTSDPQQAARFRVRQFGFYAGDQWRIGSNFSLTYGVRMDIPTFPDKPTRQSGGRVEFRVRDRRSARRRAVVTAGWLQLRARPEQHGTDPRRFRALLRPHAVRVAVEPVRQHGQRVPPAAGPVRRAPTATCRSVPDPNAQPTRRSATFRANEIDVIDPDYKYPSLMRGNLAYDRELGVLRLGRHRGVPLYEERQRHQVSEPEPGAGRHASGWPTQYPRNRVPSLSDVILLTNTDEGRRLEPRVQSRPAIPEPVLHERFVPLRRVAIHHGRHSRRRPRRTSTTSTAPVT